MKTTIIKKTALIWHYVKLISGKMFFGQIPTFFKFQQICRLLCNLAYGARRRRRHEKQLRIKIPPVACFSVTQRCNLNCLGCYTKNQRSDRSLTAEEIARVIRKVSSAGTNIFMISGGEPLLVKNILPLLGRHRDCIFFFFTNGTLLGEKELRDLKKYKHIIPVIATEGDSQQTDSRRGEGISVRLSQIFRLLKRARLTFGCSVMATRRNLGLITLRDFWERKRKEGISFGLVIDYVPFPFNINPAFILTTSDIRYKKIMLAQRRKDSKLLLFTFPLNGYRKTGDRQTTEQAAICGAAGKDFIHINAAGYVEPCPFSHFAKDNILHKSYASILQSDFLCSVRQSLARFPQPGATASMCQCEIKISNCAKQTGAASTEKPLVRPKHFPWNSSKSYSLTGAVRRRSTILSF